MASAQSRRGLFYLILTVKQAILSPLESLTMPANYRVTDNGFDWESKSLSPRSAAMTANDPSNPRYRSVEYRSRRDPNFHVFVYNLSRRTFDNPAAPGTGIVGRINLLVPGVTDEDIPETEAGVIVQGTQVGTGKVDRDGHPEKVKPGTTKWRLCTSFPDPVVATMFNDLSEQIAPVEVSAIRFVVDQINPENPTNSLNVKLSPNDQENDFSIRGVFFSLSNPPMEKDVEQARERMEGRYKRLVEKIGVLEVTNDPRLHEALAHDPDYGLAAQYFGKQFKFNQQVARATNCENCGEQKPASRLFHQTSFGSLCVERTEEAWRAVVESGVRKYEDVPEKFQWKKEKASVKQ